MDVDKIKAALMQLKTDNSNQWTTEGLPKLESLKFMTGEAITRSQLDEIAPGFTRENPKFTEPAAVSQTTQVQAGAADETLQGDTDGTFADSDEQPEPSGEFDTSDEALEAAEAELQRCREVKARATQAMQAATEKVDAIIDARVANTVENPHEVFQGYQAMQQKLRDETARRIERTKNLDLESLLPKRDPIDSAMKNRPRQK